MVLDITHRFESSAPDGADLARLQPSTWGEAHKHRWNVFDRGAVEGGGTNSTSAVQDTIDELDALGGGTVLVPGHVKADIIFRDRVTIKGANEIRGKYGATSGPSKIIRATADYAVDVPPGVGHAGLIGIDVDGGFGSGGDAGGVRLQSGAEVITLRNVHVDNCAQEGVLAEAGSGACTFEDILTTNVVLDRTRSAKIGGVDINGYDHFLHRIEAATGGAGAGLSHPSMWIPAIMVRGSNHFITNCIGELSDVGIDASLADLCSFDGCRADLNYGHGFVLGPNGSYSSCRALNNSQETDNTYSGWYNLASGGNSLAACRAYVSTAKRHKYNVEDHSALGPIEARTRVVGFVGQGHGTAPFYTDDFVGIAIEFPTAVVYIPDGTTTPDVGGCGFIALHYATPTTVTNLLNGVQNQRVLVSANGNATLANNANIQTKTNANETGTAQLLIRPYTKIGSKWYADL